MKYFSPVVFTLFFWACESSSSDQSDNYPVTNNEELTQLYEQDQADRITGSIDWATVMKRDSSREARVYEMLDSSLVVTGQDHYHAAMIFQHGSDTTASRMAVKMMQKAILLDSSVNKWLLAAAIDRNLMRRGKPQIYGTQYRKMRDKPWKRYTIDSTVVTDAERTAYGVETLAEQREKVIRLNRKSLSDLVEQGKSLKTVIEQVKAEYQKEEPEYDVSETALNMLGYQYLGQDQKDNALAIFELNVTLYPEEWNAWDSYGEGLYKVGKKAEARIAYRKSLELYPKNRNAKEMMDKLKKEIEAAKTKSDELDS